MAKVNLTPFASSMHVEGETGGGSGGGTMILHILADDEYGSNARIDW